MRSPLLVAALVVCMIALQCSAMPKEAQVRHHRSGGDSVANADAVNEATPRRVTRESDEVYKAARVTLIRIARRQMITGSAELKKEWAPKLEKLEANDKKFVDAEIANLWKDPTYKSIRANLFEQARDRVHTRLRKKREDSAEIGILTDELAAFEHNGDAAKIAVIDEYGKRFAEAAQLQMPGPQYEGVRAKLVYAERRELAKVEADKKLKGPARTKRVDELVGEIGNLMYDRQPSARNSISAFVAKEKQKQKQKNDKPAAAAAVAVDKPEESEESASTA